MKVSRTIKNIKILVLLFTASTLFSCKKFLDIPPPKDQLNSSVVFQNDKTANATLVGIYSQMISNTGFSNAQTTLIAGLSSDELDEFGTASESFKLNAVSSTDESLGFNFWTPCYSYIYQANAVLENLQPSANVTPALKSQLIGEAKFIRAFCYFYLINIFGNVPLQLSTDFATNSTKGQSTPDEVYQQIITDLKDAEAALPANYVSAEKVRPIKWAAAALLARTYLYHGEWSNAEAEATEVIGSGLYGPLEKPELVFLKNSREAIWQLMPTDPYINTKEGALIIPNTGQAPDWFITTQLYTAFEGNDLRKTAWLGTQNLSGTTYFYPYKYKVKNVGPPYQEYYMVLRLAEQYLIRAESRAQQNNLNGAIDDLDIIRKRAGLLLIKDTNPGISKNDLLLAIEKEQRIEFFAEWGHRWFDLKRKTSLTNPAKKRADDVLSLVKSDWQSTDIFYPIPALQIKSNKSLKQNPGYQ